MGSRLILSRYFDKSDKINIVKSDCFLSNLDFQNSVAHFINFVYYLGSNLLPPPPPTCVSQILNIS